MKNLVKVLYKKNKKLAIQVAKTLNLADLSSFENLPKHIQKVLERIGWGTAISSINEAPKRYTIHSKFGLIDKNALKELVKEPSFLHVITTKPFFMGLLFKK